MNIVLWSGPSLVVAFAGAGLACFAAGCFNVARRISVKAQSALSAKKYILEVSRILFVMACAAVVAVVWTYLLVQLQVSVFEFVSLVAGIGIAALFLNRAGLFVAPNVP